ncbi:hypothetical protein C0J52_27325 [Blattella germanica]|nr:hypothetical protein C0J52_27325 [Blattella germanica]
MQRRNPPSLQSLGCGACQLPIKCLCKKIVELPLNYEYNPAQWKAHLDQFHDSNTGQKQIKIQLQNRLELNGQKRRLTWEATPRSIHEGVSSAILNSDCLVFDTSIAQLFADNGNLGINVTISMAAWLGTDGVRLINGVKWYEGGMGINELRAIIKIR